MKAINIIEVFQSNLLATVSFILSSIAFLSLPVITYANEYTITVPSDSNKKQNCPFPFYSYIYEDDNGGSLFYNCKNISWADCSLVYEFYANCTKSDDSSVCTISNWVAGYDSGCSDTRFPCTVISCSNGCKAETPWDNGWDDEDLHQSCVSYIVDAECPATVDYFNFSNLAWKACHNNTAVGSLINTRHNEHCKVKVLFSKTGNSINGVVHCPSCYVFWYERDVAGFISVKTDPQCIEAENDKSCSIPHFNHEELVWNWCVKGDGEGQFTNIFKSIPERCSVKISSVCITGAKSCGLIKCGGDDDSGPDCTASWNMPEKPESFESPDGCISQSNPLAPDNANFVVPVSVAGGVVLVGVVSTIITIAACFGYHRYKRLGYQHIEGQ